MQNHERSSLSVGQRRIEFQHFGVTQSEVVLPQSTQFIESKREAAGPTVEWAKRRTDPGIFVPPTGMYVRRTTAQAVPFSIAVHSSQGAGSKQSGKLPLPSAILDRRWCDPEKRNLALLRAQANAKGQVFNIGEMFFTRMQTAAMVYSSIMRVVDLARRIKRMRPDETIIEAGFLRPALAGGIKGTSKRLADVWLEYKYGWLPLYQDAWNAYQLLREADKTKQYTAYARGTYTEDVDRVETVLRLDAYGGSVGSLECASQGTVKHRARIDYAIPFDAQNWQRTTGIDNPVLLAWELLPWSFVIDWWVPIGTYLQALDYARGLTFRGAYASSRAHVVHSARKGSDRTGFLAVAPTVVDFTTADSVTDEYHRVAYSGFPRVELPMAVQRGLGTADRIVTALALLRSQFN